MALLVRQVLLACSFASLVSACVASGLAATPAASAAPLDLTSTEYGYSVAISGSIAVVGAPGLNQGQGAVYVFQRSGKAWRDTAKLYDPARIAQDAFGWSVSVTTSKKGIYLAVGETGFNSYPDLVYVYKLSGRKWHLQASLRDPESYYGDNFGGSVAITPGTLVVGASTAFNQEGAVYIYSRSGAAWTRRAAFKDPRRNFGDGYGYVVAASGNTVIATALGFVYAYTSRTGRHWSRSDIIANPADPGNNFGTSAAIYGSTAVVGAPGNGTTFSQGAAYVFVRSGAKWQARARLVSPNGTTDDDFGQAVSIFGNRILVGAPVNGQRNCGTAYEFHQYKSAWIRKLTLRLRNCQPGDQFGSSTSVWGRTGVIGAPDQNRAFLKPDMP